MLLKLLRSIFKGILWKIFDIIISIILFFTVLYIVYTITKLFGFEAGFTAFFIIIAIFLAGYYYLHFKHKIMMRRGE